MIQRFFYAVSLIMALACTQVQAGGTYLTLNDFKADVFADNGGEKKALWLTKPRKEEALRVLGDSLNQARIRFHSDGETHLWVLSEIGKEKPITFGVVTHKGAIDRVEVMVFRESRGDEIRLPQYTAQYQGQRLTDDGELSSSVDGISGATYSVRSMKKVAKLALLLDGWAAEDNEQTP